MANTIPNWAELQDILEKLSLSCNAPELFMVEFSVDEHNEGCFINVYLAGYWSTHFTFKKAVRDWMCGKTDLSYELKQIVSVCPPEDNCFYYSTIYEIDIEHHSYYNDF